MYVDLEVTTCGDYFKKVGKEIDWENNDSSKIPVDQANKVQEILATEVSIYLLRRTNGICGSLIDSMADIRSKLIEEHDELYEEYVTYNDFY